MSDIYNADFFAKGERGMIRSAHAIVPVLVEMFHPQSVIDVGCGEGWFLKEFASLNIKRLVGIEPNVDAIAAGEHVTSDLDVGLFLGELFDLCLCLEVAEHLAPESADALVDTLCSLSDRIVFSAAIPKQGGNGHLNEQWPSYWISKFAKRGWGASNRLRFILWNVQSVESWYAQNMLLFEKHAADTVLEMADIVHPRLWSIYRGG